MHIEKKYKLHEPYGQVDLIAIKLLEGFRSSDRFVQFEIRTDRDKNNEGEKGQGPYILTVGAGSTTPLGKAGDPASIINDFDEVVEKVIVHIKPTILDKSFNYIS